MAVLASKGPTTRSASHSPLLSPPASLQLRNGCSLLLLLCGLALLPNVHCACYTAKDGSGCTLCLSDDSSTVNSCSYSQGSGDACRYACCRKYYAVTVPRSCQNTDSTSNSDSSLSISTIVVIVVFSIPVAICVILLIHSCIVGISRTPAQPARPSRDDRHAASAVNLENFNIEECFPYYIDPQQTCSICLQSQCHVMTLCGHPYHSACLRAWLKKRQTCPLCVSTAFNPIAAFCTGCGKSLKMGAMFSRMNSAKKAEWAESTSAKCTNCLELRSAEDIEISMQEEEVERYQRAAPAIRREGVAAESQARVNQPQDKSPHFH